MKRKNLINKVMKLVNVCPNIKNIFFNTPKLVNKK